MIAVGFVFFAPKVETALSGAGWQANGSESVQARNLIQDNFGGLSSSALMVVCSFARADDGRSRVQGTVARVTQVLHTNAKVASVVAPRPGATISADGHTAIVMAGAKGDPTAMVAVADTLKSAATGRRRLRRDRLAHRRVRDVERLQHREPHGDDEVRAVQLAGDARDPRARVRLDLSPPACR